MKLSSIYIGTFYFRYLNPPTPMVQNLGTTPVKEPDIYRPAGFLRLRNYPHQESIRLGFSLHVDKKTDITFKTGILLLMKKYGIIIKTNKILFYIIMPIKKLHYSIIETLVEIRCNSYLNKTYSFILD